QRTKTLADTVGARPSWEAELLPALPDLQRALDGALTELESVKQRASDLAARFGQPDSNPSLERCDQLVRLAELAFQAQCRPDTSWLVRAGLERAQAVLAQRRATY